jgi:hypothetical protein
MVIPASYAQTQNYFLVLVGLAQENKSGFPHKKEAGMTKILVCS